LHLHGPFCSNHCLFLRACPMHHLTHKTIPL
jgi:hypothetical protein